jgi:hypothetical protein
MADAGKVEEEPFDLGEYALGLLYDHAWEPPDSGLNPVHHDSRRSLSP